MKRLMHLRGMVWASAACLLVLFSTRGEAAGAPSAPAAAGCRELILQDFSGAVGAPVKILSADLTPSAQGAPLCQVKASIENFIDFQLSLPVADWTGRILFAGNGYQPPEQTGAWVVTSWSDLGHRGEEDIFNSNYQYRVNYGYRGLHLIVLGAKAIVQQFYHHGQRYSYYAACSEPAREGMVDLERYPEDYDGVVAGCAPMPMTVNNGIYNTWNMVINRRADGSSILTDDKLPLLHRTVVAQCDAADGLKDGLISDGFNCHPDLSAITCKPGEDASGCLSADQVRVVNEVYRSAHDAAGEQLVPRGPLPGSELAWAGLIAGAAHMQANYEQARVGTAKAIRSLFSDPPLPESFQVSDIRFDRTTFDALTKLHFLYDGTDPDLTAFSRAGHKLILWHGMADAMVPTAYSVNYYAALEKTMGAQALPSFLRFYLFPGVYHCGGGEGPSPSVTDFLLPLMRWVEHGQAPEALIARHVPQGADNFGADSINKTEGSLGADRSRPVYPYPFTARYVGRGSIDDAASFTQGPAMQIPASTYQWMGASFYTPGYEKWCTGKGTSFTCTDHR